METLTAAAFMLHFLSNRKVSDVHISLCLSLDGHACNSLPQSNQVKRYIIHGRPASVDKGDIQPKLLEDLLQKYDRKREERDGYVEGGAVGEFS